MQLIKMNPLATYDNVGWREAIKKQKERNARFSAKIAADQVQSDDILARMHIANLSFLLANSCRRAASDVDN